MYTLIHNKLLAEARARHGKITLCPKGVITEYNGYILLWYNSADKSTHIVKFDIANNCIVKQGE